MKVRVGLLDVLVILAGIALIVWGIYYLHPHRRIRRQVYAVACKKIAEQLSCPATATYQPIRSTKIELVSESRGRLTLWANANNKLEPVGQKEYVVQLDKANGSWNVQVIRVQE